jgi:hypothetical protein
MPMSWYVVETDCVYKTSEQHVLKARAAILEAVLRQGEANERIMQKFKEEVRRFTELQIDSEEVLREVLQRLIERIEIELDGGIVIHYDFGNPLSAGVYSPPVFTSILSTPHMWSVAHCW